MTSTTCKHVALCSRTIRDAIVGRREWWEQFCERDFGHPGVDCAKRYAMSRGQRGLAAYALCSVVCNGEYAALESLIESMHILEGRMTHSDEELLGALVGRVEEQGCSSRESVSPGSPDFLVVGLQASGKVPVNDPSYIGSVNPHPKGVGRDHHAETAF